MLITGVQSVDSSGVILIAACGQPPKAMKKPKILLIDDEPGLLRLMTLMLRERYEVRSVTDATEALAAVVKFKPDLVILDWIMPAMNGGDVAQQIRADPRICDTRILFLSAVILKREKPQEVVGFPAVDKPIGLHELVEAIEEQLAGGRRTPLPSHVTEMMGMHDREAQSSIHRRIHGLH
jgi:two-component system OmpR family response regulator